MHHTARMAPAALVLASAPGAVLHRARAAAMEFAMAALPAAGMQMLGIEGTATILAPHCPALIPPEPPSWAEGPCRSRAPGLAACVRARVVGHPHPREDDR